jgi:hypothetical protein
MDDTAEKNRRYTDGAKQFVSPCIMSAISLVERRQEGKKQAGERSFMKNA